MAATIDETPTISALQVDRGYPTGNSLGNDDRLALHVKIKNKSTEPINVNVVNSPSPGETTVSISGEALSVASGASADVITYTVPALTTLYLSYVESAGTNIAAHTVQKNGTPIAKQWTYFSGDLTARFAFEPSDKRGLQFDAGDIVKVSISNDRPTSADFYARLIGVSVAS